MVDPNKKNSHGSFVLIYQILSDLYPVQKAFDLCG